ncbi:DNA cytosine methyltransferase [Rhizobium sp. RAF36]|uniref:DNA cytosine methyltransferase n=1 Tax=Rhizobium sp. RAF36 TaxID=3233055 RepID=UPI003F9D8AB4
MPKFIDLFAGCGGLSLGLAQSGMRGLFAIERDPMAFRTFAANMVEDTSHLANRFEWPAWLEQRAWAIDELLEEHRQDLARLRGGVDVLAGGPPCQGFSFAGRRVEDDPRNMLFQKYVEAVEAIRPAALILENVPGMKVVHRPTNVVDLVSGQPRKQSFYEKLAESLDGIGYDVQAMLVDASRFGVPQKRSRLIAIGVRKDMSRWLDGGVGRVFKLLEDVRSQQLAALSLDGVVSAAEALSDLETSKVALRTCDDPESPPGFLEGRRSRATTPYQRLMRQGGHGHPNSMRLARHRDDVRERFARILAECRRGVRMDDESRRSYGLKKHRIYPLLDSNPAPTVTTLPDDVLHYSEPRILTVRETARLQSFPDWFEFKGKYTTGGDRRTRECPRYTQVGNAVPPLLARAIGTALTKALAQIQSAIDSESASPVQAVAVSG